MRKLAVPVARLLLALLLVISQVGTARAASVIRDTEIEAMIRAIADPIFHAARLEPSAIDMYVLSDPVLNAFVAGGQNMFLNTGLLIRTETPEELAGVIAHETGHIAGGHLTRLMQAMDRASAQSAIGMILGMAAAVAGAPQLGTAIMAGGLTVAQRGVLSFSRSQEQQADQAGVGFLADVGLPPEGMRAFFQTLDRQNLRITTGGDVYLRTHPLTADRIDFLREQEVRSPLAGRTLSPALHEAHARSRAKLDAFLGEPRAMLTKYQGDTVTDRYARAIAHHRLANLDEALALVRGLEAEAPGDPYFHELEGQILFENGRVADAVAPYREALRLKPDAALIRLGLARALLELGQEPATREAAAALREVTRLEPRTAQAWRFLGIALGRLGEEGPASLALVEQAVLLDKKRDAKFHLGRAKQHVQAGDPAWLRLQDLEREVEEMEDEERRRRR
ncbi:M48 family metalloprotease [Geminicoccaceae bacterium 1502E]|nr:M48 family metalloprotease [Geminicoccaceae bacterium 1502E]